MAECKDCKNYAGKEGVNPARPDMEFFNCTMAKMMGENVGMQVRPDSRACEAFVTK